MRQNVVLCGHGLKADADHKLNVAQLEVICLCNRNRWRKRIVCALPVFPLFPLMFSNVFPLPGR